MINTIALCKNEQCEKKDICKRYLDNNTDGCIMEFKNICPNDDYKWYWKADVEINKKEGEN